VDADVSQKFTWPVVRVVDPAVTTAVAVTGVPEATVDTGAPAAVRVSVVAVGPGAAVTETGTVVEAVSEPEVPVMVTVPLTGAVPGAAVNVITLDVDAGFGEMETVTPLGRPEAAKVTLPAKPLSGTIVRVDCFDAPGRRSAPAGAARTVKLEGETVSVRAVDAISEPEVPVTVSVDIPGVAVLLAVRVR
jgi:hypothetical protein